MRKKIQRKKKRKTFYPKNILTPECQTEDIDNRIILSEVEPMPDINTINPVDAAEEAAISLRKQPEINLSFVIHNTINKNSLPNEDIN